MFQKVKAIIKKMLPSNSILYKILKKIYHILNKIIKKLLGYPNYKKQKKHLVFQINNACKIIHKYKNSTYIVFYNPTWLGVANSTKGLFENIIPLEQVLGEKNIKKISKTIVENNIKTVVFSQIVDGWTDVIKNVKLLDDTIKVKVIWHANNYEVLSDYTWDLNKTVLSLYDKHYIDCFAFVKESMVSFYTSVGYRCKYLINNVKPTTSLSLSPKPTDFFNIKIGVYNANSRELKNVYTQLSSIKLINHALADIVPTNPEILDFLNIINLDYTSLPNYIPTEDLLTRIQKNDINIYVTFTECSPMFPLESFEMGIPCLVGNNNDYFQNTELGEYIIINKEDDPEYIKNKILICLENKEKILNLYKKWKSNFDKKCKNNVDEFLCF